MAERLILIPVETGEGTLIGRTELDLGTLRDVHWAFRGLLQDAQARGDASVAYASPTFCSTRGMVGENTYGVRTLILDAKVLKPLAAHMSVRNSERARAALAYVCTLPNETGVAVWWEEE